MQSMLFPMSKIQTFESNSQPLPWCKYKHFCCFRCQRYKLLKAIHNPYNHWYIVNLAVSDVKDTNFWKQFTTSENKFGVSILLFPMSKIQTFESNSQRGEISLKTINSCFRCQRYKLLKAIHNWYAGRCKDSKAVSDVKDTNFWKQFTTRRP